MKFILSLGVLSLLAALIVFGPLAVVWSVNVLFPRAAIPYALDTWAAVLILGAFFRANVTVKK
jgi:hypothetical protein